MAIVLQSFEITNLTSNASKSFTLTSDKLDLTEDEKTIFLAAISDLTSIGAINLSYKAMFSFQIDSDIIIIEKNYLTKEVVIKLNEEVNSSDINAYILEKTNINWSSQIFKDRIFDLKNIISLDQLSKEIESATSKVSINPKLEEEKLNISKKIEDLKTKGNPEEITKMDRLTEIEGRIKNIQTEIDFYQNEKKLRDEINQKIEKKTIQKDKLTQMVSSVSALLKNREAVQLEITKFGQMGMDNSLESKVENLKESRSQKLLHYLSSVRSKSSHFTAQPEEEVSFTLSGIPVAILAVLQLILTIILYLTSLEVKIIYTGTLSILLLSILLLLINVFKDNTPTFKKKEVQLLVDSPIGLNPGEDKFFINAAWVKALRHELDNIDNSIKMGLNNRSFEEVQKESVDIDLEVSDLKKQLGEMDTKSLTSEEYYKKRRELDILKIEKENIEYTVKDNNIDTNELSQLESDLTSVDNRIEQAKDISASLPLIFVLTANVAADIMEYVNGLKNGRQVILVG